MIICGFGSGHREFRFGVRRAGRFGDKGRLQCFDVVWKCAEAANRCDDRIMNLDPVTQKKWSIRNYPARSGRKVWTGFRQSIPSSM